MILYAAVFGLRAAVAGGEEALALLYVLPISLVAITFGARAGVIAGVVGVGLLVVWVVAEGESFTLLGWVARVTPMLLLGGLLGAAADQTRAAEAAERRLLAAELREREAAEINDAIVQRLAAAKWAFEVGDCDHGMELLTDGIETAQALVAELLTGKPDRTSVSMVPANSLTASTASPTIG